MQDEHATRHEEGAQPSPSLTRARIIETAVELVHRDGLRQLTMRRLGAECHVEAMALYRYVDGREDLLDGIVEFLVDRLYDDQLSARREEDAWQDFLQRLAHGVRQIALDHPQLFPLIATRPPEAPWVRPPLRSLRWMDTFLQTLLEYGFGDSGAVAAYRSYTTFLLGHLLLEVSAPDDTTRAGESPAADPGSSAREPDLSGFPNLQRLQTLLAEDHSLAEFEGALETQLDRIEDLIGTR